MNVQTVRRKLVTAEAFRVEVPDLVRGDQLPWGLRLVRYEQNTDAWVTYAGDTGEISARLGDWLVKTDTEIIPFSPERFSAFYEAA